MSSVAKAKVPKGEVKPLYKGFDATGFDCGKDSLNEWLIKYAWANHASDSAKTFIYEEDKKVLGYYSLAAGHVHYDQVVIRISAGQPKSGKIPITVICRLAVDKSIKGQKIGTAMLKHALLNCLKAADSVASRAVIVHALDKEAEDFYKRYDFEPSPLDPSTLMIMMKDLRATFEAE